MVHGTVKGLVVWPRKPFGTTGWPLKIRSLLVVTASGAVCPRLWPLGAVAGRRSSSAPDLKLFGQRREGETLRSVIHLSTSGPLLTAWLPAGSCRLACLRRCTSHMVTRRPHLGRQVVVRELGQSRLTLSLGCDISRVTKTAPMVQMWGVHGGSSGGLGRTVPVWASGAWCGGLALRF